MKKYIIIAVCISVTLMGVSIDNCKAAEKDHVKAFLLSFAVPGLGQYYAGSAGSAKVFIASELVMWGAYFFNTTLKNSYHNDYIFHASLHAGVKPSGLGDPAYLNAIGFYQSSFEYNQYQKQVEYDPVLYIGDKMWDWDENANRLRYKNLRERELDYKNYIKYLR